MGYTISRNQPTHTTVHTVDVPVIPFTSEYATARDDGDSVDLTNILTDLQSPTHARYSIQNIANVYKQTDISAENRLPVTKGVSLMVGRDETWTVTSSDDPSFFKQFPMSGHLVIKPPQNGFVTADMILAFILDLIGELGLTDADPTGRLDQLLRGALNPRV